MLVVGLVSLAARLVWGQTGFGRGRADLLASVLEYSDYPEDPELLRRLEDGVPVNVIQRPETGQWMGELL